jgi:uncharacterized membrane protein YhaH (DUF805 family)
MFFGHDNRSAQGLLETTLGRIAIGLVSLVGLFLAGISVSRSNRTKFQDLEDTFPTGFEVTAGRWLAGLLGLTVFLAEPIVLAATQGPLTSLLAGLPTFLGEAVQTVAFASAFAWVLTSLFKPGRWTYPLLAAGWLGFLLGPTLLADRFPSASLLNFMRQGVSFFSELWGRLLYGDQPFWFNLFYTGLLLLCLAILMLSLSLRRFHRPSLSGGVLLAMALTFTGWSGMQYVSGVQAAQTAYTSGTLSYETNSLVVTEYDLTLDLKDVQMPHFSAEIKATNHGSVPIDTLAFRLNPTLTVTDASMPFERNNDLVIVHLSQPIAPEETLSLSILYQGVLRVESISEGVVEASDFIDPGGVRLTPTANWYPVPLLSGPGISYDQQVPARIRLTVINSDGLPFAANLPAVGENTFESNAASWVFLIGSPHLVVEQVGEVTLITSQADLEQARVLAGIFEDPLRKITPFFPEAEFQGLILMVLGEESGLPGRTPPVAGYPLVVTPRYSPANSSANMTSSNLFVMNALVTDLWVLSGGELDPVFGGPVTSLERAFQAVVGFLDIYVVENGDPERMQAQTQSEAQMQRAVDENQLALVEIYHQGGQEAVRNILYQMYQKPDELRALPYKSLPQWIRSAGGMR